MCCAKLCVMTKESCLAQVKEMARFSGLELTTEQINLYITLRDNTQEKIPDSDPYKPLNALRPSTLCDQEFLAEIIKVTDNDCLRQFTESYPSIFLEELS